MSSYLAEGETAIAPAETKVLSINVAGLPLPTCAEVRASALVGGTLAYRFYQRYPRTPANPAGVDETSLDTAALDNVVR